MHAHLRDLKRIQGGTKSVSNCKQNEKESTRREKKDNRKWTAWAVSKTYLLAFSGETNKQLNVGSRLKGSSAERPQKIYKKMKKKKKMLK